MRVASASSVSERVWLRPPQVPIFPYSLTVFVLRVWLRPPQFLSECGYGRLNVQRLNLVFITLCFASVAQIPNSRSCLQCLFCECGCGLLNVRPPVHDYSVYFASLAAASSTWVCKLWGKGHAAIFQGQRQSACQATETATAMVWPFRLAGLWRFLWRFHIFEAASSNFCLS